MLDLLLRCHDFFHEGDHFLSEQNVVIPDEGDFVLHTVYDCVDKLCLVKKSPSIPGDLLKVLLFAIRELATVEFTFEKNHSEQVKQVDLLSIVFVIDRGPQSLYDWAYYNVLNFSLKVRKVFD